MITQKMRVSYIDTKKETKNKLIFVKKIKEISKDGVNGSFLIGLKEAKQLVDSISYTYSKENTIDFFDVNVPLEIDKIDIFYQFQEFGVKVQFNEREKKLKRILYSDIRTLMEDMLMEKWESFVSEKELATLPYKECKEIAVQNIIKDYDEYIEHEFFYQVTDDIARINKLESKDIGFKFMKFNEEFGEFNAEYIKFKGFTYKGYDKEELKGEMADALQILLSIYNHIGNETGIKISDILETILEKNKKWELKINEYGKNK